MRQLAFFLSAVILTGCVRFEPRPIVPAETAARFEQRRLDNPALKTFLEKNLSRGLTNWPAPTWDFEMLVLAAFYYHPSLEVARAQWRVAHAGIKTAGGRPNPTLTAGPGYNVNAASGETHWMPFVTLDVPIETAGKRSNRINQAQLLSEAARLNIASTIWQVRSKLRTSLLDFVAAQRREELLQRQIALQEELGGKLEQQLRAGAIGVAETTAANVLFAKVQTEQSDAQRQFAEARVRVADAVGIPVAALEGTALSFDITRVPATDNLTSADARRAALQGRADILGALAEYGASQSALQLEIAKQFPDVHLAPGYQWDQGESKWQIGLTVELPVLNQNQGPIAAAEARRAEAAARFAALQAKVISEIDRAVAVFDANRRSMTTRQSIAAAQTRRREIAEAQFKAGAIDTLERLAAELELDAATLAGFDAQVKLQESVGALEDALQSPLALPATTLESSSGKDKEAK